MFDIRKYPRLLRIAVVTFNVCELRKYSLTKMPSVNL